MNTRQFMPQLAVHVDLNLACAGISAIHDSFERQEFDWLGLYFRTVYTNLNLRISTRFEPSDSRIPRLSLYVEIPGFKAQAVERITLPVGLKWNEIAKFCWHETRLEGHILKKKFNFKLWRFKVS